jgi:mannose-6-phosphate isomerase-like protein (cupin superfamily)
MAERKHDKYFIKDYTIKMQPDAIPPEVREKMTSQREAGNYMVADELFSLDGSVIDRGFYVTCVLIKEKKGTEPVELHPAHSHDFDEILLFTGTDTENPRDLGGEIEVWLEDEQYIVTESCLIFVPSGMRHCPIAYRRIDRPVYFITAGNSTVYEKLQVGLK